MKFLILLSCFLLAEPYKILMYSNLFGHSHIKIMGAIADTLTDAGHDVTVLMPVLEEFQKTKTMLKTTKKQILIEADESVASQMNHMNEFMKNLWTLDASNPIAVASKSGDLADLFSKQCNKVLKSSELIEQLKNEKFDIGITEPFDSCAYPFFEAINLTTHVAVLSCARLDHVSDVIGQPVAPSYVPGTQSVYGEKMNIWERFLNILQFYAGRYVFANIADIEAENAKKILGIERTWRETLPEASYIFSNYMPLLEFPAPTFDKIIPIGGISVKLPKDLKLDSKFDKILSVRKNNVMISFGSNVKSKDMPDEFKKAFLEVFKSMPDTTFIWKYENEKDTIVDHLDNVYLGEWLPQNELLADPRLTLFVTHGGLGSVNELALMGKPAVMVPIFADQGRNAAMLKRHGGAEVLHKLDLADSGKIIEALKKVINDKSYKKNAERLAELLNNQPEDPKEVLVKHVEFAARFGKLPSLDPYGRHQSLIEYYLIDMISIFAIIIFVIVYIIFKIVTRCCCKPSKVKFE